MHDQKWLQDPTTASSLHSGSFITSTSWAPTCDVRGLKCLACLCAKVTTRTSKIVSKPLLPVKTNVLKWSHLVPGSCILVDHYMSSVMGRLPHTFGQERVGYSCSTLFVDHASRKFFNFCQYSTNANETISSKRHLESLACQEGIMIKEYHADNGIFASNVFKGNCDSLHQRYSFSGVGAHHQNGVGNLHKGYIRNVPLPRVPREQSTKQSQVPPNRIPHYYENTYTNPTYKGTCRIGERISPPWQPNAINT
jgi:hypothetical protein